MAPLSLTVAALTFRRPADLRELIPLLVEQTRRLEAALPGRFSADVLIVDNDSAGTGRAVVEAADSGRRLRYVLEPRPGISAARNRALRETQDRDVLVFIDDDERPSADWLVLMVQTWLSSGSAAVGGAVRSTFDPPLDPWIEAGGFFTRRRAPTGTAVQFTATNNLLLDLHRVRELGLSFDEDFGLSGGEDTLFTQALTDSGSTITWCNEAMVTDVVPTDRATRRWVLLRAVSMGNSLGRVRLRLAASASDRVRARLITAGGGAARIAAGLGKAAAGVPTRSMAWRAQGLRTAARGLGMSSAAVGYVYHEYRR